MVKSEDRIKPPARLECDKIYNRLKDKKVRGKISLDEWNDRAAKAQTIKGKAERAVWRQFP